MTEVSAVAPSDPRLTEATFAEHPRIPHLERALDLLWEAGHPRIAEALRDEIAAALELTEAAALLVGMSRRDAE